MKYGSLFIIGLSLVLACASGNREQDEASMRSSEPTIANCVEEETTPEGAVRCKTCADNFKWDGVACKASGSVCASGTASVMTFVDENGVTHFHCLAP